jgi:hypothetical protein
MEQLFDMIKRMKEDGSLQVLLNAGMMSPKVLLYFELYAKYLFYASRNYKTSEAVRQIALTTNVCERTIYKAISVMKHSTAYNHSANA